MGLAFCQLRDWREGRGKRSFPFGARGQSSRLFRCLSVPALRMVQAGGLGNALATCANS